MVSILNINYGIKEPTHGIQYIVLLVKYGYLMGISRQENLCIPSYCLGQYILDHIDSRAFLQRYEGSCIVYRPEWY